MLPELKSERPMPLAFFNLDSAFVPLYGAGAHHLRFKDLGGE
jgi:hypothetical protein